MDSSLLQTGLLENAAQGAWSQIVARFSRDGNAPGLAWMLELPVTTAGGNQKPSVLGKQSEDFADFHSARLSGGRKFTKGFGRLPSSPRHCHDRFGQARQLEQCHSVGREANPNPATGASFASSFDNALCYSLI